MLENVNIREGVCKECAHRQQENRSQKESNKFGSSTQQRNDEKEKFISKNATGQKITSTGLKHETIVSVKETDVVPVRPPRRRRKIQSKSNYVVENESSTRFSSYEIRNSSTNKETTDTSSIIDNGNGAKLVKVQIESHAHGIADSSKEISNSSKSESCDVNSALEESTLKVSGERTLVTSLDDKNDSLEKVETRKTSSAITEFNKDHAEESNTNNPSRSTSQFHHPSTKDPRMMFQINRLVNASTSTKISSHSHELKEFDTEQIASLKEVWQTSSSCSAEEYSITVLKEVLSVLCNEEKDCALELSTSRPPTEGKKKSTNTTLDDDSRTIKIHIRKYHKTNQSQAVKNSSKSSVSELSEEMNLSCGSKERSKTRLSSIDSTSTLSSTDRSSYYTIRLSTMDQAIFQKKNPKKDKSSKLDRSKKLSKIFHCQMCV